MYIRAGDYAQNGSIGTTLTLLSIDVCMYVPYSNYNIMSNYVILRINKRI